MKLNAQILQLSTGPHLVRYRFYDLSEEDEADEPDPGEPMGPDGTEIAVIRGADAGDARPDPHLCPECGEKLED